MGKTKDRGKSKQGILACMIHEASETMETLSETARGGQGTGSAVCGSACPTTSEWGQAPIRKAPVLKSMNAAR
ncbi:MAG: hypothetical protein CAF43_004395 [Nitrospira sp. CG24C]|nr:MAG: hypothetical protein CAF43_004395 [Nitrospira sp. CG24C]